MEALSKMNKILSDKKLNNKHNFFTS